MGYNIIFYPVVERCVFVTMLKPEQGEVSLNSCRDLDRRINVFNPKVKFSR